jgi:glycerate-2-kinase
MLLTTQLDGEARDMGRYLTDKAINYVTHAKKIAFISGGETTVTIRGEGHGGRNQEMVLGSVKDLSEKDVVFSSFATDGIDGMSDAAGAIADAYTLGRANEKKIDPEILLKDNNSYEFFKNLDDLIITGSTGTNVMDIQILLKIR